MAHSTPLGAHEALLDQGLIEPVGRDEAESQVWRDCELATYVENRCFERIDPRGLSVADRARWQHAYPDGFRSEGDLQADQWYRRCYWLLDRGERVGSVAISSSEFSHVLELWSIYVFLDQRRQGITGRFLLAARRAARAADLAGIRLSTEWTWPESVAYYLRRGLWVWGWKRSIHFFWSNEPEHRLELSGDEGRFLVEVDGASHVVIEFGRRDDRLIWKELPLPEEVDKAAWRSQETLAVHLALAGWPLIRSDETWAKRFGWCDCGYPEGLARKIQIFEALERQAGVAVRTPRIPGLDYPEWDDIE